MKTVCDALYVALLRFLCNALVQKSHLVVTKTTKFSAMINGFSKTLGKQLLEKLVKKNPDALVRNQK